MCFHHCQTRLHRLELNENRTSNNVYIILSRWGPLLPHYQTTAVPLHWKGTQRPRQLSRTDKETPTNKKLEIRRWQGTTIRSQADALCGIPHSLYNCQPSWSQTELRCGRRFGTDTLLIRAGDAQLDVLLKTACKPETIDITKSGQERTWILWTSQVTEPFQELCDYPIADRPFNQACQVRTLVKTFGSLSKTNFRPPTRWCHVSTATSSLRVGSTLQWSQNQRGISAQGKHLWSDY